MSPAGQAPAALTRIATTRVSTTRVATTRISTTRVATTHTAAALAISFAISFAISLADSGGAIAADAPSAVGSSPAAPPSREAPPSIIFILADDLGWGDLSCQGQTDFATPRIDRLASEGMRFRQFYAGSTVCAPSRCVLMTGLHSGHAFIRGNAKLDLRPSDLTVAEVLHTSGYTTGLVGKWGLGHEGSTGMPTRKGFDEFLGYLDQTHAHNYYPSFLVRGEKRTALRNVVPKEGPVGQGVASIRVDYSHDLFAEEALSFVRRHRERPFFLYLAFTIPHANNEAGPRGMEYPMPEGTGTGNPPSPLDPQKAHAAMIERMDRDVGRLLDELRSLGIEERTLVFFSSDNGPHREGGFDPAAARSSGPFRGIKRDLTEGGIRVPFLARWPGRIAAGKVSEHVGYFADFLPTAAEIAGAPVPPEIDGISIVPELLGRPAEQRKHEFLYWEFHEGKGAQAIRAGKWKAIAKPFGGPIALYDLEADPGESHDLAAEDAATVERMRGLLEAARTPSPQWPAPWEKKETKSE